MGALSLALALALSPLETPWPMAGLSITGGQDGHITASAFGSTGRLGSLCAFALHGGLRFSHLGETLFCESEEAAYREIRPEVIREAAALLNPAIQLGPFYVEACLTGTLTGPMLEEAAYQYGLIGGIIIGDWLLCAENASYPWYKNGLTAAWEGPLDGFLMLVSVTAWSVESELGLDLRLRARTLDSALVLSVTASMCGGRPMEYPLFFSLSRSWGLTGITLDCRLSGWSGCMFTAGIWFRPPAYQ